MSDGAPKCPEVEEWRSVPGWEGVYSVSSTGRIRSEPRTVVRRDGVKAQYRGRILRPAKNSSGRWTVLLCREGVCESYSVHKLVALAFLDNPENLPLVRHINDNPEENQVSNLAWGTYSDNQYDRVRNGIYRNGMTQWTHCKRGHEYTDENTYRPPNNPTWRRCRTCARGYESRRTR